MFGRGDDQTAQNTTNIPDESIQEVVNSQPAVAPDTDPVAVVHPTTQLSAPAAPPVPSAPPATDNPDWQHPGTPLDDTTAQPSDTAPTPHELIDIKQQALSQLSPLLSTLDQSPEEKFRTLMMMIQASDDQSLIKTAYDVAEQIKDEKARAQALLDIVNEINYFTTQHQAA